MKAWIRTKQGLLIALVALMLLGLFIAWFVMRKGARVKPDAKSAQALDKAIQVGRDMIVEANTKAAVEIKLAETKDTFVRQELQEIVVNTSRKERLERLIALRRRLDNQ